VSIAQYVRLLRLHWLIVIGSIVLGGAAAATYSRLSAPVYRAQAQLFVSTTSPGNKVSDLTQGGAFTQKRVKSYADLLTSPRVLEPVIQQLRLPTTPDDLARQLVVTNPLDTVLLDISVDDTSPQRASDIANAVTQRFPELVAELETPAGGTESPVKISVTQDAVTSTTPVSPRVPLNILLGLLAGAGAGVLGALAREGLDRTVSGRAQASEIAGAPILGAVADDASVPEKPLVTHDAFSPRAEAFRQLRTNIRFLSVDHPVRSFVVTGSVQGEGKSSTAANIAISLAQGGENVLLIDADLRRPTLADVFGLPNGVGLTSVLVARIPVGEALQAWRDDLPLHVLTAGPLPPNPSELIGSARMADIVRGLTGSGYTVVIDSPPLLPVTDAAILARITDGALIVARPASTRVEQLSSAVEALRTASAPILGVVLNRVPRRGKAGAEYRGYGTTAYASYASQPQTAVPAAAVPAAAVPQAAVPAAAGTAAVPAGLHAAVPGIPEATGSSAPPPSIGGTLLPVGSPFPDPGGARRGPQ
jgi:capsular exopolysaccharide synthesis family protein